MEPSTERLREIPRFYLEKKRVGVGIISFALGFIISYNSALMKLAEEFVAYREAFLRLIFPSECALCSEVLEIYEHGLCSTCQSRLDTIAFSPEDAPFDPKIKGLSQAWSLYPYQSPAKEVLSELKFNKKRWLVQTFRTSLMRALDWIRSETAIDVILPVPIDRNRLFQREFNQSEILARLASSLLRIPLQTNLVKRFSTPAQSSLGRHARQVNLYGAFDLKSPQNLHAKNVLLVDDIFTTGATIEAAAENLKKAGAKKIVALTLARTEIR